MNGNIIRYDDVINKFSPSKYKIWQNNDEQQNLDRIIIVLDDDPTGSQTVHSIPVYTSWNDETIHTILNGTDKLVYILTNSRGLTASDTEMLHRQFARDLAKISKSLKKEYILISRSDSTLRGHYPLETEVLKNEIESNSNIQFDGEIIIPFFLEGGRFTFEDVHYVKNGDELIPAGMTEFARDKTFGYTASDLKEWVEEKTKGKYKSETVTCITLDEIRNLKTESIFEKLMSLENFNKMIVNALNYEDLEVFSSCLKKALKSGKNYLFRTAASFVKVIGNVPSQPLLTKDKMLGSQSENRPGLIIIGSHVAKTTQQFEELKKVEGVQFIEFDVRKVIEQSSMEQEISRVRARVNEVLKEGNDACVYTSREYHQADIKNSKSEANLLFSVKVSEGLVRIVKGLEIQPGYIIAKGGITSSDIGVKALNVKKAEVMGQILPGVPVWKLNKESMFPNLPYVIFPGNVGQEDSLRKTVELLKTL